LDLLWFRDQINAFPVTDRWSILAKAAYKGDLDWVQRALTIGVLSGKAKSIPGKVNYWLEAHRDAIERWKSIIADMRSADTIEFAILFVAIRELLDLAEIQE
jgi:glutamate dehydrogenase